MANVKKPRVLNDDAEITVINNTSGLLFYRSPRTMDEWEWAEYGDEHEMKVSEIKSMKAQNRRFLDEQWIIPHEKDYDVIPYLKLEKFYKNIVTPEQIDSILEGSAEEVKTALQNASANVKDLIFNKAKEKFQAKELTDVHVIDTIETTLGVEIDSNRLK